MCATGGVAPDFSAEKLEGENIFFTWCFDLRLPSPDISRTATKVKHMKEMGSCILQSIILCLMPVLVLASGPTFLFLKKKHTQINAGAKNGSMEAFAHCEESAGILGAHVIKSVPVLSTVPLRQVMVESKPD